MHLWTEQSPLKTLKTILSDQLPTGTELFLFGSRAKGTATEFSDYDLAFRTSTPLSFLEFLRVRAAISETPRRVDLVDLSRVQA